MHKKRYWIIGIFIFIVLLGAILDDEHEKTEENINDKQTEEIDQDEEENTETENIKENQEENEEDKQGEEEEEENNTSEAENEEETPKDKPKPLSDLKAHFIDVGQADATLFQYSDGSKDYHILFDTGDWNRKDVVSYLQAQAIDTIDLIVISHPHADHIGQLADIMNQFKVHEVWMSGNTASSQTFQKAAEAVLSSEAGYEEPRAGEIYDIGPLSLEVLHPSSLSGDLNQDSISIRFSYGEIAFLLTGDAYKKNEIAMINQNASVDADILQLGHHGSNTSTDPRFLDAVNPDLAIYSASSNNSYGHPHAEVVSLIQNKGIDLYGTDVHGTIVVTTDGKDFELSTNKQGKVTAGSPPSSKTEKKGKGNKSKASSKPKTEPKKEEPKKEEAKKDNPPTNNNCIDLNHASLEKLQEIIHIGPVRVEDLVELRPYQSIDDLTKIKGIGPARIIDIKEQGLACVGG